MSRRISFKVSGKVQGVSFRYYTVKEAKSLGVTGYVQNTADGAVIGEAQGSDIAIKDFVRFLKKGPPTAVVSGVEQSEMEMEHGESVFQQKR